ncbi:hypothetical protein [Microscilla marina]|uniref:Conserved domain protein n=1 Tax=Microscilla marina ATCC 23134 TaxID=313606 RepID=A1ZQ70_MICM2|nr:hypothetical protein [Microscilla marina]EAY27479.1 conserved domain protein [Microscilla marina ATCC 23134]
MGYKFEIIIEEKGNHYEAYAPKIPECRATGASYELALKNTRAALKSYIGRMNDSEKASLAISPDKD